MVKSAKRPVVLVIMDGFGIAPADPGNAVLQAKTSNLNQFISEFPTTTIRAAGEPVGLPWQEVGNSEVGHMNIGSGRVMYQDLPRINKAIADQTFFSNPAFKKAADHVKKNNSRLHFIGLVSSGGVHSHVEHLLALLDFAKQEDIKEVYIHFFADGRDVPAKSAPDFVAQVEEKAKKVKRGKIATVIGRYYIMDRDQNWERVAPGYRAMVFGEGPRYKSALEGIEAAYAKGLTDETIEPFVVAKHGKPIGCIGNNDAVIFFDYRSDRARQVTKSFVLPGFEGFDRGERIENLLFVTMTIYDRDLPVEIAYPKEEVVGSLGEVIAEEGLKQFRIAETEKYAHVTVFFNSGRIDPFKGEERRIIPSPPVPTYDQMPEMSAQGVTDLVIPMISSGKYGFVLINYANPDMVGHTGKVKPAIKGIETVDRCLAQVVKETLKVGGAVLITADHGNCEVMINLQTGDADKEHTANPVNFIIIDEAHRGKGLGEGWDLSLVTPVGVLADVAPTVLDLMGIPKPKEMSGISLIDIF